MLNLFEQYKWLAISIGVALWSGCVWHISSVYTESSYTKDKLAALEKNVDIIQTMSKNYQESLANLKPKITTINKEIQHEVSTNTIYRDCKSTDNLVREYESKLDLQ